MSRIEKNLTVEGRREGRRKGSVGHCLHLAKAIRGRQFGYSTYDEMFNKEN